MHISRKIIDLRVLDVLLLAPKENNVNQDETIGWKDKSKNYACSVGIITPEIAMKVIESNHYFQVE